jgi:hypothetical protein
MLVRAVATVSSGEYVIHNVDVTPLATFKSSTPQLAVSQQGMVSVTQNPAAVSSNTASTGFVSVGELVNGTAMQISPLSVEILSSEACIS